MGRARAILRIGLLGVVLLMVPVQAGLTDWYLNIAGKIALQQEWNKKRIKRKDIKTMQERFIMDQKGKKSYMPFIYGAKGFMDHIFAVPVRNAVGTIDFDNGITLIKFKDQEDELDYQMVKKDFLEEVNGEYDFGFSPLYSDEEIAYTQTKWFVFANLKTKQVISPEPLFETMGEFIRSFAVLDAKSRLFCVEHIKPASGEFYKKILEIYSINGDKFEKKGELPAGFHDYGHGYSQPWQVYNGLIFTYDSAANRILCHDSHLQPTKHLFTEVFNRNNGKFRKLKEFVIHPALPFALVVEEGKDLDWAKLNQLPPTDETNAFTDSLDAQRRIHILYLLRWDTPDEKKQFIPLHTDAVSLIVPVDAKRYSHFQFSPDGSWVVFRDDSKDWNNPGFIALPISGKNPTFVGEPLFLGKVLREGGTPQTTAWVKDPLSFVVCDGAALYKWELGNVNQARVFKTDQEPLPLK